jgi:hypothetical protein
MSDIEINHAKPALTPFIVGRIGFTVTPPMAKSIAIFAFKTAAVLDLMPIKQKRKPPFFSRRIRADFRRNLTIPPMVSMWMCPYIPGNYRADAFVTCYDGNNPITGPIQLYVCTYAVRHFAFQVLSVKSIETRGQLVAGDTTFNNMAVRFWPDLIPGLVWPRPYAIHSVEEFQKFHRRWEGLFPIVR